MYRYRKESREGWLLRYQANLDRHRQKKKRSEKVYKCLICGAVYPESMEQEHESTHSDIPENSDGYIMELSRTRANREIKRGVSFIGLILKLGNVHFPTEKNALKLPDLSRIKDYNLNLTIWDARAKKFHLPYMLLWLLTTRAGSSLYRFLCRFTRRE